MSAYVKKLCLQNAHSDVINCIAFSPTGKYLASGGEDSSVIIWRVSDGRFIYRLLFQSPVDALLWLPIHSESLVSGCRDGTITQGAKFRVVSRYYLINVQIIDVLGFQTEYDSIPIKFGAIGPVICFAYSTDKRLLAVGHGHEVHITNCGEGTRGQPLLTPGHLLLVIFHSR